MNLHRFSVKGSFSEINKNKFGLIIFLHYICIKLREEKAMCFLFFVH